MKLKEIRANRIVLLLIFLFFCHFLLAQADKTINLQANSIKVAEFLTILSKETNLRFSYNPDLIPLDSVITVSIQNKSVEMALQQVIGSKYQFIKTNDFIVIKRRNQPKNVQKTIIKGNITDKANQKKISDVSIVAISKLTISESNIDGDFELEAKQDELILIAKADYKDTIISNNLSSDSIIVVSLEKKRNADSINTFSLGKMGIKKSFWESKKRRLIRENLPNLSVKKLANFSLFPRISSSGRKSSFHVPTFSFNLFSGNNYSVNGIEIGLGINFVTNDVKGFQLGLLGNFVGGNTKGLQVSGVLNSTSDTLKGVQISTFNYARVVKGVQLGVINIADSSAGLSLGVLNFVKKGYHELDVYTSDWALVNVAFKTGTHRFYNILKLGMLTQQASMPFMGYGFGFSTQKSESRLWFDFDFTCNYPLKAFTESKLGLINSFDFTFAYRILKSSWLFVGPSINVYVYDNSLLLTNPSMLNNANVFVDNTTNTELWVGYKAGIRF